MIIFSWSCTLFCPQCKIKIDEDSIFCSSCGTNIKAHTLVKEAKESTKSYVIRELELDSNTIYNFMSLNEKIDSLSHVKQQLEQQESFLMILAREAIRSHSSRAQ